MKRFEQLLAELREVPGTKLQLARTKAAKLWFLSRPAARRRSTFAELAIPIC